MMATRCAIPLYRWAIMTRLIHAAIILISMITISKVRALGHCCYGIRPQHGTISTSGQFCTCARDYDPETETAEMWQCVACEDWYVCASWAVCRRMIDLC